MESIDTCIYSNYVTYLSRKIWSDKLSAKSRGTRNDGGSVAIRRTRGDVAAPVRTAAVPGGVQGCGCRA